jgi:5-(carboxyamino)imidazole ribonucleotide synthase
VFGSGQLGRMFAIAARTLGYRVQTFSPETDTPTGQIADKEIVSPYEDLDTVRKFAREVDVITFEFENVPFATVKTASEFVDVFPRGEILHTTQNRLREKTFLFEKNFPVTPFKKIANEDKLRKAFAEFGAPCVLKTAGFGYDGKGQTKISVEAEIAAAFAALSGSEAILEKFIEFEKEISVVAARDRKGNFVHYGAIENSHSKHILDVSFAPAIVSKRIFDEAIEITRSVLEKLDVVGVMCVEFFLTRDEKLLINELAPRPHNSGHLTIDACVTSQFEQQLRAVCGFPLGSTAQFRPAAMANLLGDLWLEKELNFAHALADENVKLHLYGKIEPRAGRKMGHFTALADTVEAARLIVEDARGNLGGIAF